MTTIISTLIHPVYFNTADSKTPVACIAVEDTGDPSIPQSPITRRVLSAKPLTWHELQEDSNVDINPANIAGTQIVGPLPARPQPPTGSYPGSDL